MKHFLAVVAATAIALVAITTAAQERSPSQQDLVIAQPLLLVSGAESPATLQSADVTVDIAGGFARTTLLLTLHNPNDRALEGTLQFPLQPGQQVAGFALDIDGRMRDAVPVPKQIGRQVFESIERRQVDPALLEQVAGNHFRLRIYPIPAQGTRQVRLVLDEAMRRDANAWRLDVPVRLLAGAEAFALQINAKGERSPTMVGGFQSLDFKRDGDGFKAQVQHNSFRPRSGLSLHFPVAVTPQILTGSFENEHYVLAEIPLADVVHQPRKMPDSVGLLWDASGSARQRDLASELALLDRYFQAMSEGRVSLRLLRDVGEDGGSFQVRGGDWSALRKVLESTVYDGASNLADWTPQPGIDEYLLVSDGLQNYGDDNFPTLDDDQRLYALASSGAQADSTRLTALAQARGGRLVAWQGSSELDAAASALLEEGARIVALRGDGIVGLLAQSHELDDGLLRVAGRLTAPAATLHVTLDEGGTTRTLHLPVTVAAADTAQVPRLWAAWQVDALSAEPERNRAAIARIGQQFALVTPGTSLLVLDDPADYVRYDIPAPAALRKQVALLRKAQSVEREVSRSERLDQVAKAFAQRIDWWEREFPKGAPPHLRDASKQLRSGEADAAVAMMAPPRPSPIPPPPAPPAPPAMFDDPSPVDAPAAESESQLDSITVTGSRRARLNSGQASNDDGAPNATIRLQAWQPDSTYARRLRAASPQQIYVLYLDERDSHANSTAFYLDVANLLLQNGRRDEALRVLSNLAELELENRHVLRVLGYRLMQAKAWALAVQVFQRVLDMADEEPQSHRDLGLALVADGQRQKGIEHLYEVVARQWDSRFSEIELVVLNELNAIIATSPEPLDTAFVDRRLLRNMPLDLRAVLAWDSDNSDMDLWVTDPNGEKCYYARPLTYQGGLLSDDFTGGYGPEEFVLRDAKPGIYKVQAHYFGDRQQIVTGATTLTLRLSTGWGTAQQRDQVVTLRLSGRNESVLVGEFEVE